MLSRTERLLKAAEEERERYAVEAKEIITKAESENRDRSDDENAKIAEHQEAMNTCKKNIEELKQQVDVEQDIDDLGRKIGVKAEREDPAQPARAKSWGEQFTASEGYARVKSDGFTGHWRTGMVDLEGKTTLAEGGNWDAETGSPGAGSPLVPIDQQAGIVSTLYQRLTISDLLASGTTSSNAIRYVTETTASNDARIVAEGAAKPEQELAFDQVDEPVKKIAAWLPVTDEMLEDAAQIQSYLNARLSLFVRNEEEAQVLGGAGGANLTGLMPRVPVAQRYVTSDADTPNSADHIYEALTVVRINSFLEPDGIVVHPDDWAELRLLKDGNDNYIGGSPFSNTGVGEPGESLWSKRVVVTQAIPAGTALVGAFSTAAQLFRRGGLSVEASNSHSDYFIKNLTAIRAEERVGLAVYRPSGFALADIGYPS